MHLKVRIPTRMRSPMPGSGYDLKVQFRNIGSDKNIDGLLKF
jgi:hypothetical protein